MPEQHLSRARLLTPAGAAAIAVVRIAGPQVLPFLQRHFSGPLRRGRCTHGNLIDPPRTIDDPVIMLPADGAFAEISLHGGPWVVRECLDLLARGGFTIIEDQDDLDLLDGPSILEREMLAAIPAALTEQALRLLLAQPRLWAEFRRRGDSCTEQIRSILEDRCLWWMLHPPRVAIIGAPNVGKSTLANQLFGRVRSITADLPGTTRDWVADLANIDGLPVHLLDTPGQRCAADPIEEAAIQRSRVEIERADLRILLLDASRPLEPDQSPLISGTAAIIAINKIDCPPAWDTGRFYGPKIAALAGTGIEALQRQIRLRFGCDGRIGPRPCWWTDRQRGILEQALTDPATLDALYAPSVLSPPAVP